MYVILAKEVKLVYEGEFPEIFRGIFLEDGSLIGKSRARAIEVLYEHKVPWYSYDPNAPKVEEVKPKPRKIDEEISGKVVKVALKKTKKTQVAVCKELGMSTSHFANNLKRDVRVTTWLKTLAAMGYRVRIEEGDGDMVVVCGKEMRWRE